MTSIAAPTLKPSERLPPAAAYLDMRTLIAVTLATHLMFPPHPVPDPIARLDDCIQKRFLDRTSFGMMRILPNQYHGVRQFQPENPAERAVVSELQQQGYEVALFLAGRGIQSPLIALGPRSGVQGPAYITRLKNAAALPPARTLLEESRTAFATFATGDGYQLEKDGWTIALRPLRASNSACLGCHSFADSKPKPGDALGVVLYLYRR